MIYVPCRCWVRYTGRYIDLTQHCIESLCKSLNPRHTRWDAAGFTCIMRTPVTLMHVRATTIISDEQRIDWTASIHHSGRVHCCGGWLITSHTRGFIQTFSLWTSSHYRYYHLVDLNARFIACCNTRVNRWSKFRIPCGRSDRKTERKTHSLALAVIYAASSWRSDKIALR